MTTALDLAQDAAEKIGVYAAGETMNTADAQRILTVLNNMMDSWSNESLTCYQVLEQSGTLNPGQNTYTIGTSGSPDFNTTRPIRILEGPGTVFLVDTNNNRYPVDVVPRDVWNTIWNIKLVNSNLPDTLFYDPKFPLGELNFYPQPNMTITAHWNSYLQLSDFATLATPVSLPPGYIKAIVDSLAITIWPYFKADASQPTPWLIEDARKSKANIKRSNVRENMAVFEKELTARGGAVYNVYSDSFR